MAELARLFSERYKTSLLSFDVFDLHLPESVREQIVVAMALHSGAINKGMDPAGSGIRAAGGRDRAVGTWRPLIRTILAGSTGEVFDLIEGVCGRVSREVRRDLSLRVNRIFEEAELPWRLRRGNVRFLYLIYERL